MDSYPLLSKLTLDLLYEEDTLRPHDVLRVQMSYIFLVLAMKMQPKKFSSFI